MYDNGVFQGDNGFVGRYDFSLALSPTPDTTIKPLLLKVSTPLSGIDDRDTETTLGASITFNFSIL